MILFIAQVIFLRYRRPAAATELVGSAPDHVTSAVGPYVDGTSRPSKRRMTLSCVRWWAVCSTRRQNIQMRWRSTSKKGTVSIHQDSCCSAKKSSLLRTNSMKRVQTASTVMDTGRTCLVQAPAYEGIHRRNVVRREADGGISHPHCGSGCGLKSRSESANSFQVDATLFDSLT
jgi:hypothetical protein